jgi:hypothetical protein
LFSDLVQLTESSEHFGVWLDGPQLAYDDLNSVDNLRSFEVVLLEGFLVLLALLSKLGLLIVKDVQLDSLVLNGHFEFFHLSHQVRDFGRGLLDFIRSVIDSPIVLKDLSLAVDLVVGVFLVSFLLV